MKKMGTVIELSKFVPAPAKEPLENFWQRKESHPFAINFVYTPEGFFVVKGRSDEVQQYIDARFPKYLVRYTYWKNGQSRGSWRSNLPIYWSKYNSKLYRSEKHYTLSINTADGFKENVLRVRRIPKVWLPIYDQAEYPKPKPPPQWRSSHNDLSRREKRALGLNKHGVKVK